MSPDIRSQGVDAIAAAVRSDPRPSIVVEMTRQLGDILHSSVVVRQIRKSHPGAHVIWAIGSRYVETCRTLTPPLLGPHAIAGLPDLPDFPADGPYRVHWVREAAKLPGVRRAFGCGVHPWGWKRGSITDAVLINAGIERLTVDRRPWLPLTFADKEFARDFIPGPFVAMEYRSESIKPRPPAWFADLVAKIRLPVVALAAPGSPKIRGAKDGTATTIRQAKALIQRSRCFIGVGSGLSVVAATRGIAVPIVELVTPELAIPAIGYASGAPHTNMLHASTAAIAAQVNALCALGVDQAQSSVPAAGHPQAPSAPRRAGRR